jgi:hypothetical protein
MKCPYCSAELDDKAYSCPACHARKVLRRTKAGVITGWAGIVLGSQVALAWVPLPLLMLAGFDVKRIPWQLAALVVAATLVTAGLFWHSNSTKHTEWVSAKD